MPTKWENLLDLFFTGHFVNGIFNSFYYVTWKYKVYLSRKLRLIQLPFF